MNFDSDKSITLSRIGVMVLSAIMAVLDVGAYWFVGFFIALRNMSAAQGVYLMISIYACSVFAWLVLYKLWKLLDGIKRGLVFTTENVASLRVISWCCVAAALTCFVSTLYYIPFIIAAIAAAFMALIVRIVKNAFQQALLMKDELDFTV